MTPLLPTPPQPASPPDARFQEDNSWMDELDPSVVPNLDELVTEDGAPVDNIYVEKQHRLLTEPLYSSWTGPGEGRPFVVLSNVGWFYSNRQPPLVPDVLLSLDAAPAGDLHSKEGRSYFQWLIGKPPDVVIEIVSDRRGGEEDHKMHVYARQGLLFYVIFDPNNRLKGGVLRVFVLQGGKYEPADPKWLPGVGLGLTLWQGVFQGHQDTWLRWCDAEGRPIPTGMECAEEERRRTEEERHRTEEERRRADEAAAKLQRLAEQLRSLGVEPEV